MHVVLSIAQLVYKNFPHTSCIVFICFGDNGVDSSTLSYHTFCSNSGLWYFIGASNGFVGALC